MKTVVQLERTGCGIASVAMLAGVSYAQAKRVANRLDISLVLLAFPASLPRLSCYK